MHQQNELRLDRIISSQSELGPTIPDGGYGWVILLASLILQIFFPSILASYGIFMLYTRIESSALSEEPKLWDTALYATPIVFIATSTMAGSWNRSIVSWSIWPRLVTIVGIFLTCAGLLVQWIAIKDMFGVSIYILAGALTGFGSSLALHQADALVGQYFKLKLPNIKNLSLCAQAIGFVLTPIIIGYAVLTTGILQSLLIYQALLLLCCVITLVLKKPDYLKSERRNYEVLQNMSEDDEIFTKQAASTSNSAIPSNNTFLSNNTASCTTQNRLNNTFNAENETENSADTNSPESIFNEIEVATNTTYMFDNNFMDDNNITILPSSTERANLALFLKKTSFLWKYSFYKSLFFLITIKYSSLIFWMMFPTFLYVELEHLKLQQTTFIVGTMGLGCLLTGLLTSVFPLFGKNMHVYATSFCLINSVGYFVLSDGGSEGWLLFAALLVTSSNTALHSLKSPLLGNMLKDEDRSVHVYVTITTGIIIFLIFVQDTTYRNFFRVVSLLQFVSGIVFLSNVLYDFFTKNCRRN